MKSASNTSPPLIKSLRLENYRNICMSLNADEIISFSNPCFLIGPNGSGKSNLFESLQFIRDSLLDSVKEGSISRTANKLGGLGSILSYKKTHSHIRWSLTLDNRFIPERCDEIVYTIHASISENKQVTSIAYENIYAVFEYEEVFASNLLEYTGTDTIFLFDLRSVEPESIILNSPLNDLALSKAKDIDSTKVLTKIFNALSSFATYNANNFSIQSIRNNPTQIDSNKVTLQEDGTDLSNVFFHLLNNPEFHEAQQEIEKFIKTHVDAHFSFIKTPVFDNRFVSFAYKRENYDATFNLNTLSDGLIRMLLWVAILLHPTPPPLIIIDEPELGLHPQWMRAMMKLIWRTATRTQVIVATHSPDLLDCLEPEEAGHVMVVEQDEDGFAQFNTLDSEPLQEWLREYRLGELYRLGRPEIGGWS